MSLKCNNIIWYNLFQLEQNLTFRDDQLYMNLWDSLCFIIPLYLCKLRSMSVLHYWDICTNMHNEQFVWIPAISGCQYMHRSVVPCELFSSSIYTIQKRIHWLSTQINVCNINNNSTSYCTWNQSYLSIYKIHLNMISINHLLSQWT